MTPTERLFDVYEPRTAYAIHLRRAGRFCEHAKSEARKTACDFDEIFTRETSYPELRINDLMAELWAARCYAEAANAAYQSECAYRAEVVCAAKSGKPIPERPCAESTNQS